jgi:hypothetical protein
MRIAHTHHERLLGSVAQGGGSHHMFDQEWIAAQDKMEYAFALAEALAWKYGYANVEAYKNSDVQNRFSLLQNGIFDMPCTRLLLINGMEDTIFPIEDSLLAAKHGRVKDVRLVEGSGHMGNPLAEGVIYTWIDELLQ